MEHIYMHIQVGRWSIELRKKIVKFMCRHVPTWA